MSSSSKRQQTMAKRARELAVKEKRARKLEKKHAAAAARNAQASEALAPHGLMGIRTPEDPSGPAVE